jgi:hypothetical protein
MLPPLKSIGYKVRGPKLQKTKNKLNQIKEGMELGNGMAAAVVVHRLRPPSST